VEDSYEKMIYRDVVKYGLHEFTYLKDLYVLNCENKPRVDLVERYIYLQLLFLYPICPHFCEVAYIDFFLGLVDDSRVKDFPKLMGSCQFPKPSEKINYGAVRSHQYMIKFLASMREQLAKVSKAKKGQPAPKYSKAIIIYSASFKPAQL
jgi:leucyl-tRNA synthetase